MRLKDAIGSLQLGRKKESVVHRLCTEWSESADDGPGAVPLAEYPRPQFRRRDWQCLNGWWEYRILPAGKAAEGLSREADGKILVPFSPETARSGVERTLQPGEELRYRKEIGNLKVPRGKRLILHFGAVDERCIVWWNGTRVGAHRNGYLAFSFDVTEAVRPGSNVLEVCVRDDTDKGTACRGKQTLQPGGMYYRAQSGIWQTVWLETVPEDHLVNLKITPSVEKEEVEFRLRFSGSGDAGSGKKGSGDAEAGDAGSGKKGSGDTGSGKKGSGDAGQKVRVTVYPPVICDRDRDFATIEGRTQDPERMPESMETESFGQEAPESMPESMETESSGQEYPSGKMYVFEKKPSMKVRIPLPDARLWSPESPFLYPVRIEAGEDTVESYFAMRSFGTGTDDAGRPCLLLNGAPFFFHGVLDQGYWPESLMTPPADEAMIYDITQMKELGFNMLRKHVKIEPARWYWHCDRLGMVVWQDMVNGGGPVHKILETYLPTLFPPLGTHLPDRLYPLLSRQDAGARRRFEADLRRMIRQLYNCPCIGMWVPFNEGWGQFDAVRISKEVKKEDPTRPVDHASGWFDQGGGDVRSVHNYFRALRVEPDRRPFVLSEYGGADCSIAGHSMSEEVYGYQKVGEEEFPKTFRALIDQIHALAGEGLAGAVYTQATDIEEETNGLLTYDRKIRKA